MTNKIVSVKNKDVFRRFFCKEENAELFADFIAAVLEIPVETIENLEIVDQKLQLGTDISYIDIEIQCQEKITKIGIQFVQNGKMEEAAFRYIAFKNKAPYSYKVKKVVPILIVEGDLSSEPEHYHGCYRFVNLQGSVLSDCIEIHVLDLAKAPKEDENNQKLADWLAFLNADIEDEEEMMRLAEKNENLYEAVSAIDNSYHKK